MFFFIILLGVKRMITQTVNRWKIKLLAAILTLVRLKYNRLRLEVINLIFQFHNAFQVTVHRLLVLLYFFFFFAHSFQQKLLYFETRTFKVIISLALLIKHVIEYSPTLTVSIVRVLFLDNILMTIRGVSRLNFSMLAKICMIYSLQLNFK